MIFTSLKFIEFLVLLFLVYFIVGKVCPKYQWVLLLGFSIYFYAQASVKYLIFLAFSIASTYGAARLIGLCNSKTEEKIRNISDKEDNYKEKKKSLKKVNERNIRIILVMCIVLNIAVLAYVKYVNVFAARVGKHFDSIITPLGVSFYTFMSIGYCIDVCRGIVEPEKNILKYALYVSYFPHISQGPIGQYEKLAGQFFEKHDFDYSRFVGGLERILLGFFKKIIVANNLALVVDRVYDNYTEYTGLSFVFATLMYAIQLYTDFSGYMDIALGASSVLGITLDENFQTPYFSKNISEYWRRWHITLGAWFRDYVYYSVLRSKPVSEINKKIRKSSREKKKLVNKLITVGGLIVTWGCIGFWHGASLNYMGHAMWHAFFIIAAILLEDYYERLRVFFKIKEDSKAFDLFRILRTFIIVNIGYVMFRADSLRIALHIYKSVITDIFGGGFLTLVGSYEQSFWVTTLFGILVILFIDIIEVKENWFTWFNRLPTAVRWIVIYAVAFIVIINAYEQPVSSGAFLYFDF